VTCPVSVFPATGGEPYSPVNCLRVRTSRVPPPAGDRLSSRPAQAATYKWREQALSAILPLPARGARSFPSRLRGTRGHGSTRNQFHLSSGGDQAWPQRETRSLFSQAQGGRGGTRPQGRKLNRTASRAVPPKLTACNMAPRAMQQPLHFLHVLNGTCRMNPSSSRPRELARTSIYRAGPQSGPLSQRRGRLLVVVPEEVLLGEASSLRGPQLGALPSAAPRCPRSTHLWRSSLRRSRRRRQRALL